MFGPLLDESRPHAFPGLIGQSEAALSNLGKKRDLAAIEACPAPKVSLRWARADDLAQVAKSQALGELTLLGCKVLDMHAFEGSPLTHLSLVQSTVVEIEDSGKAPAHESLHLQRCRSLAGLRGQEERIRRLMVDGCPALVLSNLSLLSGLESLTVVGHPAEIHLGALAGFAQLRFLSIQGSPTKIDIEDLRSSFPSLATLYISKQRADRLQLLRSKNPDVEIKGDPNI